MFFRQDVKSTTLASRSGTSFVRAIVTLRGRKKKKKQLEEAIQSKSTDTIIDPPFLIRRHVKWKMARTKKTGQMTSEAAKEIANKVDSLEEQASQGSFVACGRQDVLIAAIGGPEHPSLVRAAGAGVTIKQYFGPAPRSSRTSLSIGPKDLEQLTQKIKDQLEESITEKVTRQLPEVGPSAAHISRKESCVDPSGHDLDTGELEKYGLYVDENPPRLVALGRLYEGGRQPFTTSLWAIIKGSISGAGNTFLVRPTHLVKRFSEQEKQGAQGPVKLVDRPDPNVDPIYLMTLTIPQLFLKMLQVMWDAIVFGHEDLSERAHDGQCLNISIIQLWILHMIETSMQAGNANVYGFLEPQFIQRSGQSQFESESYIKNWMQNSKKIAHWQMVVICPKDNVVIRFCSLHNRLDN
ncbi:hypothetical protein HKD37_05G012772 [Glycine soja]